MFIYIYVSLVYELIYSINEYNCNISIYSVVSIK